MTTVGGLLDRLTFRPFEDDVILHAESLYDVVVDVVRFHATMSLPRSNFPRMKTNANYMKTSLKFLLMKIMPNLL